MAKRQKPKYYVAQVGTQTSNFNWSIPENNSPSIVNQTATGATDAFGNTYFKQDQTQGTPVTNAPATVPINKNGNLLERLQAYGHKDLNPIVQGLNAGMQAVTGVSNMINEVNNKKYEKEQELRAITPDYYENMEGYGLNANPIFTQYGGQAKYQVGGKPTRADSIALYNNSIALKDYYKNYETHSKKRISPDKIFKILDSTANDFKNANLHNVPANDGKSYFAELPMSQYRRDLDTNRFFQRDLVNSTIDTRAPWALYDRRINPQGITTYINHIEGDPLETDIIDIAEYDPIAVKPVDLLTPEERKIRAKRYGDIKAPINTPSLPYPNINFKPSEVKGVDMTDVNVQGSGYKPSDLSQKPTKYSASYRDESAPNKQKTIYFKDKKAWQSFVDSNALTNTDTREDAKSASATGYRTMQMGGQQMATANPKNPIDPTDAYYSANATLAYYKDKLNTKLKAKNPQGFQDYFKGLVDLRRAGNQTGAADYIQNTAYNDFLTPDEVKTTLGDGDYDRYISSLQAVNNYNVSQGKQPLWGTEEGQNDINKLNYGRRFASLVVTPSLSHTNKTRGTTYNRNYTYNPQTQSVDISETGDLSIRPSNFTNPSPNRMQTGGVPTTYGLQKGGKALANVEAEQGEAFQTNDGQIAQVANDANTHEQGGVFLPNVHRVLENTSNIRKDKVSKLLRLTSADVKATTGAQVRGNMSHAEALVKANDFYEEKRNKITKKVELGAKNRDVLDKYGELSTKLNVAQAEAMPTQEQLFESLFNRQEMVKAQYGIKTGEKAKNGGKITKAQLGAYKGSKTGQKTPAGNSDAFPETATYSFQNYLDELTGKGFKYEGITNPADFQQALYDYKIQNKEFDDLKAMWSEGMHQKGMAEAKRLGFVDDKGLFKPGVLDNPENLKKLGTLYPDGLLGPRTLKLAKGKTPPKIYWPDETPQETPTVNQQLDTSITPPNLLQQKRSGFYEPLRWFDTASATNAYINALERDPGKYNPMEFNQLRYKLLDPTAALQQNQADFNAGVQATQDMSTNNPGAGMANVANLAAQKYAANNQILGNYENQNAQIKNNEITYNTQVRDKNSLADQQAREVFENKVLQSKAIQDEQKLTALDSLYKTIAENRALNRNGNLIMKYSRAFDQYGDFNGYQHLFGVNPALGMPNIASAVAGKGSTAAGGIQNIAPGKSYYNRKTGKTLYFDGNKLVER